MEVASTNCARRRASNGQCQPWTHTRDSNAPQRISRALGDETLLLLTPSLRRCRLRKHLQDTRRVKSEHTTRKKRIGVCKPRVLKTHRACSWADGVARYCVERALQAPPGTGGHFKREAALVAGRSKKHAGRKAHCLHVTVSCVRLEGASAPISLSHPRKKGWAVNCLVTWTSMSEACDSVNQALTCRSPADARLCLRSIRPSLPASRTFFDRQA